jgi:hypothetical protein
MKIGIITSWNDNLTLFKFLNKYDHEYIIYYDNISRPYWDKPFEYAIKQINEWIQTLQKAWAEKIILPPVYELTINQDNQPNKTIMPIFTNYLHNYCFKHSLTWQIWIFGDYADIQFWQKIISNEAIKYTQTENQKNTKKFHFPFKYRNKETWLWKHYLSNLSYSEPMVNSVIKHDLRYFKNANTDTIIPLNYWYFNYQTTITNFLNFKKIKFHKLEKIEDSFNNLLKSNNSLTNKSDYLVTIIYTWQIDFLIREKRLLWFINRWKSHEIKIVKNLF